MNYFIQYRCKTKICNNLHSGFLYFGVLLKKIFFMTAMVVMFTSCRDLVDADVPDFPPVPVLNALLVKGQPIEAHVSIASRLDTMQLQGISNAVLELYKDNEFLEMMHHSEDGWFVSNHNAEAGKTYSFHLSIEGYETVKAQCKIPSPAALLSYEHISIAGKDEEGLTYPSISFTFENQLEQELFFHARIRLFQSDDERDADIINIIDPVLLNEGIPLTVFSNEIINGYSYTMLINYLTGSSGSDGSGGLVTILMPLILELRSVSKEYYLFARQKYLYDLGRFPEFNINAPTAFPIFSNVEGGYGIVTGYSNVATDTIFPTY